MTNEIRVFIADDHPVFRRGLAALIDADPALTIVGEAENGEEAFARIKQLQPDVAVLDIDMPLQNGFDVVRRLSSLPSQPTIIFLTMHRDEVLFNGAFDLGAKGYLLKDSAVSDVIDSIKKVVTGKYFISPSLSTFLVNRFQHATTRAKQNTGIEGLSPTERMVLQLIAEDKTTKQIAREMGISLRTVENHRAHISQKLHLHGQNSLLKFALTNKGQLIIKGQLPLTIESPRKESAKTRAIPKDLLQ